MKRYYVRYSEGRKDLLLTNASHYTMYTSFPAGCVINRFGGHRTKGDALAWIAKVNAAAGKDIASYAGAFEAPKGYDGYELAGA